MGAKLHREKKLCVPPKYHLQIHFKQTVVNKIDGKAVPFHIYLLSYALGITTANNNPCINL